MENEIRKVYGKEKTPIEFQVFRGSEAKKLADRSGYKIIDKKSISFLLEDDEIAEKYIIATMNMIGLHTELVEYKVVKGNEVRYIYEEMFASDDVYYECYASKEEATLEQLFEAIFTVEDEKEELEI